MAEQRLHNLSSLTAFMREKVARQFNTITKLFDMLGLIAAGKSFCCGVIVVIFLRRFYCSCFPGTGASVDSDCLITTLPACEEKILGLASFLADVNRAVHQVQMC